MNNRENPRKPDDDRENTKPDEDKPNQDKPDNESPMKISRVTNPKTKSRTNQTTPPRGTEIFRELQKVNKPDAAADALAERLGGESRMKFDSDPIGREFDAISDEYIAQTKPALQQVNKRYAIK